MPKTKQFLADILVRRLKTGGARAQRCFSEASEVVAFGSMSVGLDRPDSDFDVLCIGRYFYKLKNNVLDLIGVPTAETRTESWLQSELASHVAEYGTWIKGVPQWTEHARIGPKAIGQKRRRISAFMRSLPNSWPKLEECFRAKYSVKLRRETQRLILLEQGVPVPPTRILDHSWASLSRSPHEVCDRLRQFASEPHGIFIDDLLARVDAHFQAIRFQQSLRAYDSRTGD